MHHWPQVPALALLLAGGFEVTAAEPAGTPVCNATSGVTVPTVVELYNSEGCNPCPQADSSRSALRGQPGIVGLAFHVDCWDRLGWQDRFADPVCTRWQLEGSARAGARFVRALQVIVAAPPVAAGPALRADTAGRRRCT